MQVQVRATRVTRGSGSSWRVARRKSTRRAVNWDPLASANLCEGSGASVVACVRRESMAVADATARRGKPGEGVTVGDRGFEGGMGVSRQHDGGG